MELIITDKAFEDIQFWLKNDRKILSKIFTLIDNCKNSPFEGIGKPEPLRHNLAGYWSRRINSEHRLVYKVEDNTITIIQCKLHY